MKSEYYLDYASNTPNLGLKGHWGYGNTHALHKKGVKEKLLLLEAEERIKGLINGSSGKILWTGSGSQANILAINSVTVFGSELITSNIEHKSILQFSRNGIHLVPCTNHGNISTVSFVDKMEQVRHGLRLASIQLVNNETGAINPVEHIAKYIKAYHPNVYFHTDAVQAFGKIPIDVEAMSIDMLTFSAHKCYGPKGLGGLWVSDKCLKDKKNQFLYLGSEPSTLILQLDEGLSNVDLLKSADNIAKQERQFLETLNKEGIQYVRTNTNNRLVGILSIAFPGVDAADLMFALSERGVYVSLGSACNSNNVEPSHVLKAMGIPEEQIRSTIRVSFGHTMNFEECQTAATIVACTIKELQSGC